MGWHDLSPQEVQHCSETAGWPVLIVSQTCAAVDITAHLFPASAQHARTHTHTCETPGAPQLKKPGLSSITNFISINQLVEMQHGYMDGHCAAE